MHTSVDFGLVYIGRVQLQLVYNVFEITLVRHCEVRYNYLIAILFVRDVLDITLYLCRLSSYKYINIEQRH